MDTCTQRQYSKNLQYDGVTNDRLRNKQLAEA